MSWQGRERQAQKSANGATHMSLKALICSHGAVLFIEAQDNPEKLSGHGKNSSGREPLAEKTESRSPAGVVVFCKIQILGTWVQFLGGA